MKTTLVLTRHGVTTANLKGAFAGWTDVDLSEDGKLQAQHLATKLDRFKFDKIYSSDLTRAVETAKPTALSQGISITTDKDLREMFFGEWENKVEEQIELEFPNQVNLWLTDTAKCYIENGETLNEFIQRVTNAVKRIAFENQNKTILIVTHGGVLRAIRGSLFGEPKWDLKYHPQNTALTVVEVEGQAFKLIEDNV